MRKVSPLRADQQALAEHLDWHGARLRFLAQFILALFKVKTVNLAEIATALNGRVKAESNYKRLQRFLRSFELNYAQIARLVVKLLALDAPWYLTLDRTHWRFGKRDINLLMLGIAYRGIAVPLLWALLPKAGNSNTAERIALIERFLALFGRERIKALLADREFVGQDWFEYLQSQQIPFRIRIKHNTLIPNRWNKSLKASRLFASLQSGERHCLFDRRPVWGCLLHVVALRLDNGQLLVLVTTDQPEQALDDYARRWEIETLFGCLKSRGFRFEDTHLTDPERIAKLIALLALAFVWAYRAGEIRSQTHPIPVKKHFSALSSPYFAMASTTSAPSSLTSSSGQQSSS